MLSYCITAIMAFVSAMTCAPRARPPRSLAPAAVAQAARRTERGFMLEPGMSAEPGAAGWGS